MDDGYDRHGHLRPSYRPSYAAGAGGPFEYTGQPVGFEHMGSPPKQRIEDMDPRTIAQLGYEGPEGERRKAEAINDHMYERQTGYSPRERYGDPSYRYDSRYGSGSDSRYGGSSRREEEDYRRSGSRGHGADPYGPPARTSYVVPVPVTVDRKFEEDGTVVEHVYPDNNSPSVYGRPDRGKIHYGRQDSFPEAALQDAAAHSRAGYGPGYVYERPPPPGAYVPAGPPRRPHDYDRSSSYDRY